MQSRKTPFGASRLSPAPPNVSCVPASGNLYPSGPSPYPRPGVDTLSGLYTLPLRWMHTLAHNIGERDRFRTIFL